MGYSTDFEGNFKLNKIADTKLQQILTGLSSTRRMARRVDESIYGTEGEFYFESTENLGQNHEENIIDYNRPPSTQPGFWCQWELAPDNITIRWDGNEKFYGYIDWIKYIIERILKPQGYKLNGEVYWFGEDPDDTGKIVVQNNNVEIYKGVLQYYKVKS